MFEAIVFLSLLQVLLACAPLPAGQEKHLFLQITNMDKIPVQFAWGKADIGVAATENDAKKNLRQAVKKAIVQTVKQEAKAAGVEHLVTDLNNQFKPTIYYYPLHCDNKVTPNNKKNITCTAKTVEWCCSATDKMITEIQIPGQTNTISPITPVPEPYQQLFVDLSVGKRHIKNLHKLASAALEGWVSSNGASCAIAKSIYTIGTLSISGQPDISIANAIVAGWSKEQWAIKMANVEQNLRNNKDYGQGFRNVAVKVL